MAQMDRFEKNMPKTLQIELDYDKPFFKPPKIVKPIKFGIRTVDANTSRKLILILTLKKVGDKESVFESSYQLSSGRPRILLFAETKCE